MSRRGGKVIRTRQITIERDGKKYTTEYDVILLGRGALFVQLHWGPGCMMMFGSEEATARFLFLPIVDAVASGKPAPVGVIIT